MKGGSVVDDGFLEMRGICKSFSSVPVLRNIDLSLRRGEILAVIGENGAGKSTLMKILGGIHQPTSGEIRSRGQRVCFRTPAEARSGGISLIPQEFNLVKDLCVYDNVFLGAELHGPLGMLSKKQMQRRTAELLAELGADISPTERIANLSAAQKQLVEIAKALAFEAELLIMDEPTTVLTSHEVQILFRLMRRLKERGMSIIYISHKLKEIKAICDRVLILRDGEFVCEKPAAEMSLEEMASRMVGRELSQIFPPKRLPHPDQVPALEVRNLSVRGLLRNVSFSLFPGEVLGFGGLVGAGRTEVAETIMGLRRADEGEVLLGGTPLKVRSPEDAVRAGVSYLSEDRQGSGILTGFSVTENVTLVSLGNYVRPLLGGAGSFFGLLDKSRERRSASHYRDLFNIRAPSLDARLEFLSGGNQQKVSMAKSLDTHPRVLIADEPTRGIDVSAKQEMYRFIADLAASGVSCIVISSEQEELLGLCHRVVVMRDGRIAGVLEGESLTEEEIMFHATGIREEARTG